MKLKYKIIKEGFDFNQALFDEDNIDILDAAIDTDIKYILSIIEEVGELSCATNIKIDDSKLFDKNTREGHVCLKYSGWKADTIFNIKVYLNCVIEFIVQTPAPYWATINMDGLLVLCDKIGDAINNAKLGVIKNSIINLTQITKTLDITNFDPSITLTSCTNLIKYTKIKMYTNGNVKMYFNFNFRGSKIGYDNVVKLLQWFASFCTYDLIAFGITTKSLIVGVTKKMMKRDEILDIMMNILKEQELETLVENFCKNIMNKMVNDVRNKYSSFSNKLLKTILIDYIENEI